MTTWIQLPSSSSQAPALQSLYLSSSHRCCQDHHCLPTRHLMWYVRVMKQELLAIVCRTSRTDCIRDTHCPRNRGVLAALCSWLFHGSALCATWDLCGPLDQKLLQSSVVTLRNPRVHAWHTDTPNDCSALSNRINITRAGVLLDTARVLLFAAVNASALLVQCYGLALLSACSLSLLTVLHLSKNAGTLHNALELQ